MAFSSLDKSRVSLYSNNMTLANSSISGDGELDILSKIIEKRKAGIEKLGISFGCDVPKTRSRRIVPFLEKAGVILEIKRASPSKGDIAPMLDAAETARAYQAAGARAISVLTERNFFKGTLDDLKAASAAATETAILRKDFILSAEEIDVSYLCGADAVLLIARILSEEVLRECINDCAKFGMTAFVEVRTEEDAKKISNVKCASSNYIVCGVNARDLATFSMDPLVPVAMKEKLGGRVVSESGILTPEAAAFTASMSFHGILVGEAAARDVESAYKIVTAFENNVKREMCNERSGISNVQSENRNFRWWRSVAQKLTKKPLVKICGLTNADDAFCAAKHGADLLGFVFSAKSPRCVSAEAVREIVGKLRNESDEFSSFNFQNSEPIINCKFIGVITDAESAEGRAAISLAKEGVLDAIQFHGCEMPACYEMSTPSESIAGYAAVRVGNMSDIDKIKTLALHGQPRVLIDAFVEGEAGGTGRRISSEFVTAAAKIRPLWIAGGITPENAAEIVREFSPELIDVSSGVESAPGKKDCAKIAKLFSEINCYTKKFPKVCTD